LAGAALSLLAGMVAVGGGAGALRGVALAAVGYGLGS
jgi:hypothetical protein